MAERKEERFDYRDMTGSDDDLLDAWLVFEFLDNLKGAIVDISLKGIGFQISGISREMSEILAEKKDYFLKIHAGEEFFLAGVKNRWYVVEKDLYRGGVEIEIISPDDSVRLNNLITALRRIKE